MENRNNELMGLKNEYIDISELRDHIWQYHPSNPDFINPISFYEELSKKLIDIERKINELEREINSIN